MYGVHPATKNDWLEGHQFYHTDCGGYVDRSPYSGTASCLRCHRKWQLHFLGGLDSQELGARFHIRPFYIRGDYVLVEKVEGKTRFTACVPTSEAHKFDPVRL